MAFEDRSARLQAETARLVNDLKLEQEASRRCDTARRQLETELRDANLRLAEMSGTMEATERESKRITGSAEVRVRELEEELESEAKKAREYLASLRKTERMAKEALQAEEESRRMVAELRDMLERSQVKLRQLRRQVEEAVSQPSEPNEKLAEITE
ncbi:hypothetical protein Ciccas_011705 [Cichlidogyrus casuarinus]|uniref:Myosin tail domain-containing protein n=1 Tax=Cichlidogyrus casuarinus TaxID=1844966 RepID=A0ABD2PSN3_9PLAT